MRVLGIVEGLYKNEMTLGQILCNEGTLVNLNFDYYLFVIGFLFFIIIIRLSSPPKRDYASYCGPVEALANY